MPLLGVNISLASCLWFGDGSERRRAIVSMVAGTLFSIGWWLMIDAAVIYPVQTHISASIILGCLGAMSMIVVNVITKQHISEGSLYEGGFVRGNAASCWIFIGFFVHCSVVLASFGVLMIHGRKNSQGTETPEEKQLRLIATIKIIAQNVLIFFSSMIYKFFRPADNNVF